MLNLAVYEVTAEPYTVYAL